MNPKRSIAFNVLLSAEEKNHLNAMADQLGVSQGAVLRAAIQTRWLMDFQAMPMCANGARCMAPQLHILECRKLPSPTPENLQLT